NLHIRKEILDTGRQGLGVNTLVPTLSVRGHTALDAVASVREGMPLGRESPRCVREGQALTRKRLCLLAREARSMALRKPMWCAPKASGGGEAKLETCSGKGRTIKTSFTFHGFGEKNRDPVVLLG
ncbi:unnamed protein product, partial [Gulo gulo]